MGDVVKLHPTDVDKLIEYLQEHREEWIELYTVGVRKNEEGDREIYYHYTSNDCRFKSIGALEYIKSKLI